MALRFDTFERTPSMKEEWDKIMDIVRRFRISKERRAGIIGPINLESIQEETQKRSKTEIR